MLQALLEDLKGLPDLQVILLLDDRCTNILVSSDTQVCWVTQADDFKKLLTELIEQVDLVWPIAPESQNVLADIARQVKSQQKILLLSAPDTVSMCADKLATYQNLKQHAVPVVETQSLEGLAELPYLPSVIKLRDGEGCDGNRIILNSAQFGLAMSDLDSKRSYIVQPLVDGQALSLSGLFKEGKGWLLSCNQQQMAVNNNRFCLQACVVNVGSQFHQVYQSLIDQVAVAMPDLWGYIGIDFIETPNQGLQILEINPRLTTSYVGIRQATGINVAAQVLLLLKGAPSIKPTHNRSVQVVI